MKNYLVVKTSDGSIQAVSNTEEVKRDISLSGASVIAEVCNKECDTSCPYHGKGLCHEVRDWNEDVYMVRFLSQDRDDIANTGLLLKGLSGVD